MSEQPEPMAAEPVDAVVTEHPVSQVALAGPDATTVGGLAAADGAIEDAPTAVGTMIEDAPAASGTMIEDAPAAAGTMIEDAPAAAGMAIEDAPTTAGMMIADASAAAVMAIADASTAAVMAIADASAATDTPPDAAPRAANDTAPAAVDTPEPPDPADWEQALRLAEALIFASDRPITPHRLQPVLPDRCDARAVLAALAAQRAAAPVRLVEVAGGWAFRTAPEIAPHLTRVVEVPRRLPRAAMETLAIIAYHQPVTRGEIEEIRGAALAQTTLESLLEMGLIQPRGRKEVPGRPSLWGTTTRFLEQFGLRGLNELPRREELVNEPTLPFAAPPAAA